MWDELEHAKAQLEGRYEIRFVSEAEYAAVLADMFKVTGTAKKEEEKGKGKGGKKAKKEEEDEE